MHENEKRDIPTTEQFERELKRLRYRENFLKSLWSTVSGLIVAAALAVIISTMLMPVLRVTGTEVTITASATDAGTTNSDSVTYTVTPFTITGKDNLSVTRTEGGTVDLTANAAAYWGSSDETIAAVDANGKVTFLKNGSVTIIATHGAVSDTVTFTVSSLGFTPTVTPATVHVGGTATLSADLEGIRRSICSIWRRACRFRSMRHRMPRIGAMRTRVRFLPRS